MARIVGGVATSHTPTIAFAKDAKKFDDPVWKPIFEGYEPVQAGGDDPMRARCHAAAPSAGGGAGVPADCVRIS